MEKSKIRVIMEYEFRRGSNVTQAARNMKNIFHENTPDQSTVHRWFKKFKSGDFSLSNESRGRPETKVNNDALKAAVESCTSQTTTDLAGIFEVSVPTILGKFTTNKQS